MNKDQLKKLEADLWSAADKLRANSDLKSSDLDLVLRNLKNPLEETSTLYELKEAFTESNLPIRVDIMDWARIPANFHREIERVHVVVQEGDLDDFISASLKQGV